jgi:hypothetical protein
VGQFSGTVRATATHPTAVFGSVGQLPATTTSIDVHFMNQHLDAGSNAALFARLYYSATPDMASPTQIGAQTATFDAIAGPQVFTFSASGVPAGSYIGGFVGSNTSGNTNSVDMWLTDGLSYCQFGTSPLGSTTSGILITSALIDILLTALGIGAWVAIVFDSFVGKIVWGGDLCGGLPPVMPNFVKSDFVGDGPNLASAVSRDKFWTALLVVMWPHFCQCNPNPGAGPAPVDPPLPVFSKPDAAPAGPEFIGCDGADLCTVLNNLARQIAAQGAMLASILDTATLIQRQEVPFGYVPGPNHSGLTGAGTFGVADILGLAVTVSSSPSWLSSDMETPAESFKFGDLTTGTADGYQRKVWLIKSPQLIHPVSGIVTTVTYDLVDGVTINVLELVREP